MILIRPFRAWRPVPEKAAHVGSRSYISYTTQELQEKLARDPDSFLHVIHPPETIAKPDAPRKERFRATRKAFRDFCDRGILVRDQRPCIYVYEQHAHGNISRGLITGVSVHAYLEGKIKVHEQTLSPREELFTEYLEVTGINAEPVLLATPPGVQWEHLLDAAATKPPIYEFNTRDGILHRMWAHDDLGLRERFQQTFAEIPSLYIADGHHRMASSALLAQRHHVQDVDPMAWCLAYIVPHDDLYIYNFDRLVHTLNGRSEAELLECLSTVGELKPMKKVHTTVGTIAVRVQQGWYSLKLPEPLPGSDPAAQLDAARLSELILGPFLGITDLRTDPRISFVPGIHGTGKLDEEVTMGRAAAAFHLHPIDLRTLKRVADTGGTMPPKSTYIEPKLRSGIIIYSLEDV